MGDDSDLCDVDTERSLNVVDVVQHRLPDLRVGAGHLEHYAMRATVLRLDRNSKYAYRYQHGHDAPNNPNAKHGHHRSSTPSIPTARLIRP